MGIGRLAEFVDRLIDSVPVAWFNFYEARSLENGQQSTKEVTSVEVRIRGSESGTGSLRAGLDGRTMLEQGSLRAGAEVRNGAKRGVVIRRSTVGTGSGHRTAREQLVLNRESVAKEFINIRISFEIQCSFVVTNVL